MRLRIPIRTHVADLMQSQNQHERANGDEIPPRRGACNPESPGRSHKPGSKDNVDPLFPFAKDGQLDGFYQDNQETEHDGIAHRSRFVLEE